MSNVNKFIIMRSYFQIGKRDFHGLFFVVVEVVEYCGWLQNCLLASEKQNNDQQSKAEQGKATGGEKAHKEDKVEREA